MQLLKITRSVLTSPITVIISVIIGISIGVFSKPLAIFLSPIGESYLGMLNLCIMPLVFSILITSLAEIMRIPSVKAWVGKAFLVFVIFAVVSGMVSMTSGLWFRQYVQPSANSQELLAKKIQAIDEYPAVEVSELHKMQEKSKLAFFLEQLVPHNIIQAMYEGLSLKVVLIALLLGAGLGSVKNSFSVHILSGFKTIAELFNTLLNWIITILPLGLCCVFATAVATLDHTMFFSLFEIIILVYILAASFITIYLFIVRKMSGEPFSKIFAVLKGPLLLSITTTSTAVAIPSSIEGMSKFNYNKQLIELMVPLGFSMNRAGKVIILMIIAIVSAHYYNINLTWVELLSMFLIVVFMGSIVGGGISGMVPVLVAVCMSVGFPSSFGLVVLFALGIFVSWAEVAVTLCANYAAVSIICKQNAKEAVKELLFSE